jgi:antitoxin MazE
MAMRTEIKRWGNSAAVRIPTKLLAAAHLDVNSPVALTVKNGKLIIEPLAEGIRKRLRLPFSEAELLEGLTSETAHADAVAPVFGAEVGD